MNVVLKLEHQNPYFIVCSKCSNVVKYLPKIAIITNSDDNCVTYKLPQIHIQPGQHHKPLHTPHSTTKHHHTTNLSAFSRASKSGQTENRNPFLCSISVLQIVTAALRSCLFETSTTVTYEIDT